MAIILSFCLINRAQASNAMTLNFITIESESSPATSVLKTSAKTVAFPLSEEDKESIAKMKDRLHKLEGVGLAAPQVGIAKRIAVIYIPETASLLREDVRAIPMHVIINPEYHPVDPGNKKQDFEACYSVENVVGKVSRFHSIRAKYQNEEGEVIDVIVEGFYARVLQHEIDHLDGLLITDRLTPNCVQGDKASMMKLRRAELPEEKRKHFDALLKKKGIIIDDE